MKNSGISRRDFLKTTGSAAGTALGAAALGGLLASCGEVTGTQFGDFDIGAPWVVDLLKKTGQPFKILQLADTQLTFNRGLIEDTFRLVEKAVADEEKTDHPIDLIVLTGDNVSEARNGEMAVMLVSFLDKIGKKYAPVMGNHDGEGAYDNRGIGKIYLSGKHSLFDFGPDSIHGMGNYVINLKDGSGNILYSLFMLDSNSYRNYNGEIWYDYIYLDQIDWYDWCVRGISKKRYGVYDPPQAKVVPSLAFFHIPLPEINSLRSQLKASDPAAEADEFHENPCTPYENTGMFYRMKSLGSTKGVFFGHDHINCLEREYEGIRLVYGLKSGPCSYHEKDRLGSTLITINNDHSIKVEFNYYEL